MVVGEVGAEAVGDDAGGAEVVEGEVPALAGGLGGGQQQAVAIDVVLDERPVVARGVAGRLVLGQYLAVQPADAEDGR